MEGKGYWLNYRKDFLSFCRSIKKHPFGNLWIIGGTSVRFSPPELAHLLDGAETITLFTRVLKFFTKNYSRVKSQNSYTFGFTDDTNLRFGQILYFFKLNNEAMAMIGTLTPCSTQEAFHLTFSEPDSRVFPVSFTTHVIAVPVTHIMEKCIFIPVGNTNFIARFCSFGLVYKLAYHLLLLTMELARGDGSTRGRVFYRTKLRISADTLCDYLRIDAQRYTEARDPTPHFVRFRENSSKSTQM